jgi:hypothetical protein
MKRETSDEERKLFEQTFKEGRPIKVAMTAKPIVKKTPAPPAASMAQPRSDCARARSSLMRKSTCMA